jgi:riboflavin kinase/FMN adenylyltransferase
MEIITDPARCEPPPGGSAVTIGAYDGVHLGHQALLGQLHTRAKANGLTTVVVTFDRHPAAVVRPESAPLLLCDLDQKLELLAATGVDRTVVVPFDTERANETAEEFVDEILVRGLDARVVVVGEDFHFGHDRKGNVALLREMGAETGFTVEGVSLEAAASGSLETGRPISSTRIRGLLADGRVEEAGELLGRPHQLRGPVVHGDNRVSASTPGGMSGPTAPAGPRRFRWGSAPPFTPRMGTNWSRPTSSTFRETSTGKRVVCPLSADSETSWPSTRWRSW